MAYIFKDIAKFIIITLLLLSFVIKASFGNDGSTKNRVRECTPVAGSDNNGNPHPETLQFNPTFGGVDFMYEGNNPICLAVIAPPYALVKLAMARMNYICRTGSMAPRPYLSPRQDFFDIARASQAAIGNLPCAAAIADATVALTTFLVPVGVQYGLAKSAYENTSLCGGGLDDEWMGWNSKVMLRSIPKAKNRVENQIKSWIDNCNTNPSSTDCGRLIDGLGNKEYREWYYGGVEREDISDGDSCPDVTEPHLNSGQVDKDRLAKYDNKFYLPQKYYMRGTQPGNYACERFNHRLSKNDPLNGGSALSALRVTAYKYAHKCCIEKSKTTACIERKLGDGTIDHKFCPGGNRCSLGSGAGVVNTYETRYADSNRMICVSSYDACPYNFNIGGGSTICNYFKDGVGEENSFVPVSLEDIANHNCSGKSEIRDDNCDINNKAGKCKNYCQYLNHCVVVAGNDYIYETNISSPYFSKACINFIGDSKNGYGYDTGVFSGTMKHFTAPIAQCVRETLENVFYNRAGHTKCGIINEYPDRQGGCFTDLYVFKEGENVSGNQSFFAYIQENLKDTIRLVLTISIAMQGFKILLTGTPIKGSELIMYIVKIGLVLFFATGNAWQGFFFDGVYNVSATFSTIVMNVKTSPNPDQRDGCQFGKISMPDGTSTITSVYPKGKEYLAVFDTFDCKIARYLGFGPSASVMNIAKIIIAGFFTGPIGIYFAIMVMIFGFYVVIAAFRALHIFLASAFAIILLVYVSPITIVASLFKATEGVFNRWLANLIGYSIQPIILFAYMGLFLTILDTLVIGSATFKGSPPQKIIVCDKVCLEQDGSMVSLESGEVEDRCDMDAGQTIVDPMSDSVACIINLNEGFGTIPVLEPLGVALPMLGNLFTDNGREKILTCVKAVLVLFILVSFIDEIPTIAYNLSGIKSPQAPRMSGSDLAKKVAGVSLMVQARGMGAARKGGSAAASGAKSIARELGNKGKSSGKSGGSGDDG